MRLWCIHPKYLDAKGLVALWREALLAKRVLQGRTKGYRYHPQLDRFRKQSSPLACINSYLRTVWREADRRGYSFDRRKLGASRGARPMTVTSGQLQFELRHLCRKFGKRDLKRQSALSRIEKPLPHPLFKVRKGGIEDWEKAGRQGA